MKLYLELEKGIILRHKAKEDLKTIDPILFELERATEEDPKNFKKVNKSALNKIFALRQISKGLETNKQKDPPIKVQLEDDGTEIIEKEHREDREFLNKVEGLLSKNKVLPVNKMFAVVHQLDEVLHNLGDTADELDAVKGKVLIKKTSSKTSRRGTRKSY